MNDLKKAIQKSSLGPVDPSYQRLFHLGRELKSGGRSLFALGVGKFHNYCLHLHSTQPETLDLLSDDEEEDDDEVEIVKQAPTRTSAQKRSAAAAGKNVIDLLDSDDDDEQEGKRQRVS